VDRPDSEMTDRQKDRSKGRIERTDRKDGSTTIRVAGSKSIRIEKTIRLCHRGVTTSAILDHDTTTSFMKVDDHSPRIARVPNINSSAELLTILAILLGLGDTVMRTCQLVYCSNCDTCMNTNRRSRVTHH